MKKNITIKICILTVLLAAATIIWARQDVTVRVVLNEETLIRNGQSMTLTLYIDGATPQTVGRADSGTPLTFEGETRHHSLYEYYIKVPASIWSRATAAKLEFSQVRRGDHIYIESISVKKSIYREQTIENSKLDFEVTARDLDPSETYIMPAELRLPMDITETRGGLPSLPFVALALALTAAWAILAFAVPSKAYALIPIKLRELGEAIKNAGALDALIVLAGGMALVLYHYGDRVWASMHRTWAYQLLSWLTIGLILLKIISNRPSGGAMPAVSHENAKSAQATNEPTGNRFTKIYAPYLVIAVLAIIVYIPAIFPNPYLHNDENQTYGAAEWFLAHGNFERYPRAWPHTWLVAQAIRFFGETVAAARFPSAICGILCALSVFHIAKKMTKQSNIAILSAVMFMTVSGGFSTIRMYALTALIALWMFYFIYLTLHREISYKKDNAAIRFIKKNFNFHFGYAALTLFLIWLNRETMINALILVVCAVIYVFALAVISRKRKFVNLSLVGLAILAFAAIITFFEVDIPVISRLLNFGVVMRRSGLEHYNPRYFTDFVSWPLGLYFGVFFLSICLITCIRNMFKKKHQQSDTDKFVAYAAFCYIITTVFFVYIADRYYSGNYMSFMRSIIIILISTGIAEIVARVKAPTRLAIYLLIITAVVAQRGSTFSRQYIDDPTNTKFTRPYHTLSADARRYELDPISVYGSSTRRYFPEIIPNGQRITFPGKGLPNQIDDLLEHREQPVTYFFIERSKTFHISEPFAFFLFNATDLVTYIDQSVIHKFHFIEAEQIAPARHGDTDVFRIADVTWIDDIAYLHCETSYIPEFEDALFISIEVVEQGLVQQATHRYQVLVPEGFGKSDTLGFTLPVRPKTEERSENIAFDTANWAYIYYGEDTAVIIEIP